MFQMPLSKPATCSGRFLRAVVAAAFAAHALSGCFPLAAGVLTAGGLAMVDRRTVGAQTEDQAIELKVGNRLGSAIAQAGGISVTSYNRQVLLTGSVADEASLRKAAVIAGKVENVKSVTNELKIGPRQSVSGAANDATLTSLIKASFVETQDVQAHAIKVVTDQGVAYLMGIVTEREATRAAQIAARVAGVVKVVTVFEYLTEDQIADIERRQSGSTSGGK
jgi:osmotically-inducible protein OsmY